MNFFSYLNWQHLLNYIGYVMSTEIMDINDQVERMLVPQQQK